MPEGDPEKDFKQDSKDDPTSELEADAEDAYPREDISFGRGYLQYILYVTGPIAVVLTAYILYRLLISG